MNTPSPATERAGLLLEPLDGLFFRDGRPLEAGYHAKSALPAPQTLAGALRTWFLERADCDFPRLAQTARDGGDFAACIAAAAPAAAGLDRLAIRGPWLAECGGAAGAEKAQPRPLVPMPATVLKSEDPPGNGSGKSKVSLTRLDPLRGGLPGWEPPEVGMLPLWPAAHGRFEKAAGYLTLEGLGRFLKGEVPEGEQIRESGRLFCHAPRTGIGIDPDSLSTGEGEIYSLEHLVLEKDIALYAEIEGLPDLIKKVPQDRPIALRLGGDGRQVAMRRLTRPVQWPERQPAKPDEGRLLLLLSPAFFEGAKRPWRSDGLSLAAAAVPGPTAISGWDLARGGPKPIRFGPAAGSVYFLSPGGALPQGKSLCHGEDSLLGWGAFLQGVWKHAGPSWERSK